MPARTFPQKTGARIQRALVDNGKLSTAALLARDSHTLSYIWGDENVAIEVPLPHQSVAPERAIWIRRNTLMGERLGEGEQRNTRFIFP